MKYEVLLGEKRRVVEIAQDNGAWTVSLDGRPLDADAAEVAPNTFSVLLNGDSHQIRIAPRPDGRHRRRRQWQRRARAGGDACDDERHDGEYTPDHRANCVARSEPTSGVRGIQRLHG